MPEKISYAGDTPMNVHRAPMGEKSPNGSISRLRAGRGICVGRILESPYDNRMKERLYRTKRRNQAWSVSYAGRFRSRDDHPTVTTTRAAEPAVAIAPSGLPTPLQNS